MAVAEAGGQYQYFFHTYNELVPLRS
jgi:hypothetical protein